MENETYKVYEADSLLKNISYPGRGIILGTTPDKKHFALAYFISGRSENSQRRISDFRRIERNRAERAVRRFFKDAVAAVFASAADKIGKSLILR